MATKSLQEKVAVVTGGSRGIGFFIAQALHAAGTTVVITARHHDALVEAANSIGERCLSIVCDQRDPTQIERMQREVNDRVGVPDILVNNAGVFHSAEIRQITHEQWNRVIETNLTGVFLVTQAFLPGMIQKQRGDIIMISSMSGKKGDAGTAAYNASKFGLQGFAQALTYEVRKYNIRVMVLNPSSVDISPDTSQDYGSGLHLHAQDLADTIVHLAKLPGRTLIRDMDIWGTNP